MSNHTQSPSGTDQSVAELLAELGIEAENSGAFDGSWIDTKGELLTAVNPSTGEPIASVRQASAADYDRVATASQEAFAVWRTWTAPSRGEDSDRPSENPVRGNSGPTDIAGPDAGAHHDSQTTSDRPSPGAQ